MVREIDVASIREVVARLLVEANYVIPADVLDALKVAIASEPSLLGRQTLEQLVRNYEVAAAERVPVCQDSGVAIVMLDIGQDVHLVGGSLAAAVHEESERALAWAISAGRSRVILRGASGWRVMTCQPPFISSLFPETVFA
jgi:fumarate hydratase subunit alpha